MVCSYAAGEHGAIQALLTGAPAVLGQFNVAVVPVLPEEPDPAPLAPTKAFESLRFFEDAVQVLIHSESSRLWS